MNYHFAYRRILLLFISYSVLCGVLQFIWAYAMIPSVLQYLRVVQVTVIWIFFFFFEICLLCHPKKNSFGKLEIWKKMCWKQKILKGFLKKYFYIQLKKTLEWNNISFKIETSFRKCQNELCGDGELHHYLWLRQFYVLKRNSQNILVYSNLHVPPKKFHQFLSSRPISAVEPAGNTYSTSHQVKLLHKALLFWGT